MSLVLASVSDKQGLTEFAKVLQENGFAFLASGGTAKVLTEAGFSPKKVEDYTSSPEILGGRVKTLHPFIHGGLLARDSEADMAELKALGMEAIDMLICNLYPFEETVAKASSNEQDCIENIDIGGVALLRAAAKNYERLTVICDPADYNTVADELKSKNAVSLALRKKLALKAFALCAKYDVAITEWLQNEIQKEESDKTESTSENNSEVIIGLKASALRYGENPHQKAWLYSNSACLANNLGKGGALGGILLQGKALSYNNILDADSAWRAVSSFTNPAAVVVKHLTPCGLAELGSSMKDSDLSIALDSAIACDSVSAFGSIIAVNRNFDMACVNSIKEFFVECIVAPKFSEEAKEALSKKKNLRLIEKPLNCTDEKYEFKSVLGGYLKQEKDSGVFDKPENFTNPTKKKATKEEVLLLQFAMNACTMVKSNAILLAAPIDKNNIEQGFCSVGIGCGQPNRVDAARHAISRAGDKAKNSVLASDAFFPFPDTIETAASAGIKAVIQPGGSIRDNLSIEECDKHEMTMLMTAVRHFKH